MKTTRLLALVAVSGLMLSACSKEVTTTNTVILNDTDVVVDNTAVVDNAAAVDNAMVMDNAAAANMLPVEGNAM